MISQKNQQEGSNPSKISRQDLRFVTLRDTRPIMLPPLSLFIRGYLFSNKNF